jgi:hypothetical protein
MSMSQLDQLKKFSKVVADTGDFESMQHLAAGRDNKPEFDLCRDTKAAISPFT